MRQVKERWLAGYRELVRELQVQDAETQKAEVEYLEVQWKKVKGLKKEEANTKSIMKAIAKGRVW